MTLRRKYSIKASSNSILQSVSAPLLMHGAHQNFELSAVPPKKKKRRKRREENSVKKAANDGKYGKKNKEKRKIYLEVAEDKKTYSSPLVASIKCRRGLKR